MNSPGNRPPPGPPPPYGAPPPPQTGQSPYGAPVAQAGYPQAPGYPAPQPSYPMQPYGAPQPPPYGAPQQPQFGYPPQQPYGMAPQPVIIVQNQVNPYGYAMAHPNPIKKDTALLLAVVGFFTIPGLQRFYTRQTGLGVLYILTWGLCYIGQIVDLIMLLSMSQQEFDMKYNVMR